MRWKKNCRFKALLAGVVIFAVLTSAGFLLNHYKYYFYPRRFFAVEPGALYRGGRQTPRVLERLIRKHGFRTIINLDDKILDDDPADPRPDRYLFEKKLAQAFGIQYHGFLWKGTGVGPFPEYDRAASLIADSARPVFLHCSAGSKRTGAALAAYWIRFHGLTYEQAMARLRNECDVVLDEQGALPTHLQNYYEYARKTPLQRNDAVPGRLDARPHRSRRSRVPGLKSACMTTEAGGIWLH